jgi:hypothetical protein
MFPGARKRLVALAQATRQTEPESSSSNEPWKKFLDPVDKTPRPKEITTNDQPDKITNNLSELIPLALEVHYKILKHTPLVPTNEDYIPNAKLVLATAQSIMSAQIKVDENQLRSKKQEDILTILQELRDEEKKQGVLELAMKD